MYPYNHSDLKSEFILYLLFLEIFAVNVGDTFDRSHRAIKDATLWHKLEHPKHPKVSG